MPGKPRWWINFTFVLGAWDQFYIQDRMKTAVRHNQRETPSHTEPPLRLLSVNNTNSFLSSFPVDFCFQIPPQSAVPLQQALPPPLIQLPSSNSPPCPLLAVLIKELPALICMEGASIESKSKNIHLFLQSFQLNIFLLDQHHSELRVRWAVPFPVIT